MSATTATDALPTFLQSFENLSAHFEEHFSDLEGMRRGARFLQFAERLILLTDEARNFEQLTQSPKGTYDDGVDLLTATNEADEQLFVQSKYKVRSKDDFDIIVSKFRHYESKLTTAIQQTLPLSGSEEASPTPIFMLFTSSKLDAIITSYRRSELASRPYYDLLIAENRLIIIDGPKILNRLQALYAKSFFLPAEVMLRSQNQWLTAGRVQIGTVRGSDIVDLYEKYGDALFFENIRDFLGVRSGKKPKDHRETVNAKIMETIEREPARMLERNNGITLRAESVVPKSGHDIQIMGAAIVNGCQTTMCLVHSRHLLTPECLVQVKVVETDDSEASWDVARAANHQNPVSQIDLELARYLRPQLVQKVASDQGYAMAVEVGGTVTSVLEGIHRTRVDYEETKMLYLGLFSRMPNNMFADNYTDLRTDVLKVLYDQSTRSQEELFEALFMAVHASREALDDCEQTFQDHDYGHVFKRFHEAGRPKYRAYLTVIALCAALQEDLATRSSSEGEEAHRMQQFLRKARGLLENRREEFSQLYMLAYQTLAELAMQAWSSNAGEAQVAQEMHKRISSTPFRAVFRTLRMKMDAAARMTQRSGRNDAGER